KLAAPIPGFDGTVAVQRQRHGDASAAMGYRQDSPAS
ncbi:MAG TPA: dihydroneopterin aldolase, partial [Synechococcales bacterium UBA8647]|nr:dihydroneopterin aldolase [Synechococcales bacterium UBA8647]